MSLIIISLPILGFLSGGLFGWALGGKGVSYITTFFIILAFLCSLSHLLYIVNTGNVIAINIGEWITIGALKINWSFKIDSISAIMLCVVTFISSLVHFYSIEYMSEDPHIPRFMAYLSLFTFFMLMLITGDNFIQMFLGWEGVGVASYLLINFWYTRVQANKAAIKAILMNRIGDYGILIGLILIFFFYESFDYNTVFTTIIANSLNVTKTNITIFLTNFNITSLDFIAIFLFIGCMGKSAQFGLHTWLPDAMEGPTPVSALIHAATMVTAGVFLLARSSYLYEYAESASNLVTIIGAVTAIFAATVGFAQNDIKKVIAYSTCSQLGYMIFSCGLSGYDVALFHLFNHAFFKALLFLAAGSVLHAVYDEQDMRKLGGLKKLLPVTYAGFIIGSVALTGFPFLAGYFSKDVILELAWSHQTIIGHFAYYLGLIAAFFTSAYSIRVLYLVFLSVPNGNRTAILHAHESGWNIKLPIIILSILSIFIGFLTKDLFIGFGTNFWNASLYILPTNYYMSDIEFIHIMAKIKPLFFSLSGIILIYIIYLFGLNTYYTKKLNNITLITFLNKKWYIDRLYNSLIAQTVLNVGNTFAYKTIDRGFLEYFGAFGIVNFIEKASIKIIKLYNGQPLYYIYILISTIIAITYLLITTDLNKLIAINILLLFIFITNKQLKHT